MTQTQKTLVDRAKANGGMLRLEHPAALAAARTIPADVAYVLSNVLVVVEGK